MFCQTSERLVASVAKVSFNKCPFLGGSLSGFQSNTTALLAELKYVFRLIFSLTLQIMYSQRLNICPFKLDVFVNCFVLGFFSFVSFPYFSMETLYLCITLYIHIIQLKLHVSWPMFSSWVKKRKRKIKKRLGYPDCKTGKGLYTIFKFYVAFNPY